MKAMEMIYPAASTKLARGPIGGGAIGGFVLLGGGLGLAWLAIATPLMRGLSPTAVRPAPEQMAVGAIIWGFSLVAPPSFAIVGLFRLSRVAAIVFRRPNRGAIGKVAGSLGDDIAVPPIVRLPGGRVVRNPVAGAPRGAILAEPPP